LQTGFTQRYETAWHMASIRNIFEWTVRSIRFTLHRWGRKKSPFKRTIAVLVCESALALAEGLCAKITEFENQLTQDEDVRQRFMNARQRAADLNAHEVAAWRALVVAAGIK